jgi:predicted HicB family RNase H-like nuclease
MRDSMTIKDKDFKTFNVRMKKELWEVFKMDAMRKGVTMNSLVIQCIENYRNNLIRREKKLTAE